MSFKRILAIRKLSDYELDHGIFDEANSWHYEYKHSPFIYVGNFEKDFSQDDLLRVFSQFGQVTEIQLMKNKDTSESLGYCFIGYEDQRSTILAVDNMNGFHLQKRPLIVDHMRKYSPPGGLKNLVKGELKRFKEEKEELDE